MNPTYLWAGIAGSMAATYTFSYYLGKRYSENQYYHERKRYQEQYKYFQQDDEIVPNIQLIRYPKFKIIYSTLHKIPLAVHEHFNVKDIDGQATRSNVFVEQPQISEKFRATEPHFKKTQAYKNLNLSRGHMAAAGNFYKNQQDKDDTFTYANIIPQDSDNNQDSWFTFETYQRELCRKCKSVEVISGPVFEPQPHKQTNPKGQENGVFTQNYKILGKDGIAVPTHLYKIIKCNIGDGRSFASAFIFKNKPSKDNSLRLREFQIPIQELSTKTGLIFNLNNPSSLTQFDFGTFDSTKQEYDKQVLYPRLFRANSYDSASDELRKIRAHKITQKSPMLNNKMESLLLDSSQYINLGACDRASKFIWIKKDMSYHNLMTDEIRNNLTKKIDQSLDLCTDPKKLEKIEKSLERGSADKSNEQHLKKARSMVSFIGKKDQQNKEEPPKPAAATV